MKKLLLIFIPFGLIIMAFQLEPVEEQNDFRWSEETPLIEVLHALGESYPDHYVEAPSEEQINLGRQLIFEGQATRPGEGKSKLISKFFFCTDCHNQVREDPNPAAPSPEARLEYAAKHDLKFLQSTTFWGMVNRETWYNDDYVLKYGSLVEKAHESLAASTQLCAQECSQGRPLVDWEMEAIMAYYWSLQLHLGDLNLSESEWANLEEWSESDQKDKAIELLKSKYMLRSDATFVDVPSDKSKGYGYEGDPAKGKLIYELSCQTCHRMYGPSSMKLDDSRLTFKKLQNNITAHDEWSIYEIIRHGTYAQPGHRPYMPLYPEERMSNEQVEDLRAYIEFRAEGNRLTKAR